MVGVHFIRWIAIYPVDRVFLLLEQPGPGIFKKIACETEMVHKIEYADKVSKKTLHF